MDQLAELVEELAVCGKLLVIGRVPAGDGPAEDLEQKRPAFFATAVDRDIDAEGGPCFASWLTWANSLSGVIEQAHTWAFENR